MERSASSGAVFDELAEPGGEAVGIDEMHEVAVSRPFLELDVREPLEPLALTVGDRPSEHPEAGDVEVGHDRVDPCLELGRIAAERHLPVADDDALAHLVCGEHARAERLGNACEPEGRAPPRTRTRRAPTHGPPPDPDTSPPAPRQTPPPCRAPPWPPQAPRR